MFHILKKNLKKIVVRKIYGGPFKGLKYVSESFCGNVLPKIVGSYEKELWPFLEGILKSKEITFVDVGSAEGYYAVGMAKFNPSLKVIAFEANEFARHLLNQMVRINNVKNLQIEGKATIESLSRSLDADPKIFMLMDVEGFEFNLLNPCKIPLLNRVNFLVEIHPWSCPIKSISAYDYFSNLFSHTHHITVIPSVPRCFNDVNPLWLRFLCFMIPFLKKRITHERNIYMEWFYFQKK